MCVCFRDQSAFVCAWLKLRVVSECVCVRVGVCFKD